MPDISRVRSIPTAKAKMGSADPEQYDSIADRYATREHLPHSKLEFELVRRALGDCTGHRILDLAGGTGEHARFAIEAGASHIDVVDISKEMMQVGSKIEKAANNRNIIQWHLGDMFQPLQNSLPDLPIEGYDMVLAMWAWDHAGTFQDYCGIWRNVASYLKPGGRLVACRICNPWCESLQSGKYGAKCALIQQTETKGVKVLVKVLTEPAMEFESEMTEASLSGETYVPNALGISEICSLSPEETETVKSDPDFWKEMLEEPYFVVFTGKKVGNKS